MTTALENIRAKVYAGKRLSFDDGVALLRSRDLWTIGELADLAHDHGSLIFADAAQWWWVYFLAVFIGLALIDTAEYKPLEDAPPAAVQPAQ